MKNELHILPKLRHNRSKMPQKNTSQNRQRIIQLPILQIQQKTQGEKMKTIEYDPTDYEVIETIDFEDDQIQKVQFKSGYYGVVYVIPSAEVADLMLIGTDKKGAYVNLFLEFARSQTEVINQIHEQIDKVHLVIQLDKEQSEIFEEIISKEEANDLLERLKITNEIMELKETNTDIFPILSIILVICILINIASAIWNLKGGI